jgi:tRNA threonylcarbamoyladenosine biosynthesis protein TsaE
MERDSKNLPTLEALQQEAAKFVSTLAPAAAGATLITLSGELGAGKTSFTQGVARTLGVDEAVTSPTFVLEKIYELPEAAARGFKRLVHIDAYRLESGNALPPLGFDELMQDQHNLILLEWPERVADGLPAANARIMLAVTPENTRTISYA